MSRLRMAVIGVGHLGKEHARILASLKDVHLVGVCDVNPEQVQIVAERCKTTPYTEYEELLDQVDAVSIVTPTLHHYAVAKAFLERGIPVLVEKPITTTLAQADDLVHLARARGVPLQVGHIERFNPAFEELAARRLQPKFVECERHGPFTGRSIDIGAVLDLMIHDLDLLLALNGGPVKDVQAIGATVFGGNEDMVNARLIFANGCIAHVTASRVSQRPKRRLRIWAPEGYAGIDFVSKHLTLVQPSAELRRFGLPFHRMTAQQKAGLKDEIFGKHLETQELHCHREADQLTAELQHFIDCILHGKRPRVTGEDGRAALALADRILDSLRTHRWEGRTDGPVGPHQWPMPLGQLFDLPKREAA